jgi:hypothetical protein
MHILNIYLLIVSFISGISRSEMTKKRCELDAPGAFIAGENVLIQLNH